MSPDGEDERAADAYPVAMRVGVSGKGGMGKTTIAAVLSRTLASRGHRVVAVDCDSDPNLAASLGMGQEAAAGLRPFLDQSSTHRQLAQGLTSTQLLERHGLAGPDGTILMLGARAEKAGSG